MQNDLMTALLSIKALDYILEIVEALRTEIEAVASVHRAPFLLKLSQCKFSHAMAGWRVYQCTTDSYYAIKDNSSAVIFVPPALENSDSQVDVPTPKGHVAKIITCLGNQVYLAIKDNLRDLILDATLIVNSGDDLTHLLKSMENVIAEKQTSRFEFAASIFDGQSQEQNFGPAEYNFESGKNINRSQKLAMQQAFSRNLSLIWGGPGTGKTNILACSAEAHLRAGRRVLYLGQNNEATDHLMATVCDRLQDTLYRDGSILRLGVSANRELVQKFPKAALDFHLAPFSDKAQEMVKIEMEQAQLEYEPSEESLDAPTIDKMRERLTEVQSEEAEKAVNLDTLWSNAVLNKFVINQALFVCGTFSEACDQGAMENFDVILLDDCNLIPLPQLFWALGQAQTVATICGDFKQLKDRAQSTDAKAQKWLSRNVFDLFNISSASEAESDERLSILDEQYRMHEAIAAVSDELFYEGYLSSGKKAPDDSIDGQSSSSAIVLADISVLNPEAAQTSTNGSANLISAMISAAIVKQILENASRADVGVLTTHRAQSDLINKMLAKWELPVPVATTIEEMANLKRDVVILDIVDAPGAGSLFMNEDSNQIRSDALLNTAITRANKKLYIVAHCDYLKKSATSKTLKKLLTIFEQTPGRLDTTDLLATFAIPKQKLT
ncbi:MAG: AAA domain-containing protein [Candidatus Obscuribacterales bacterium]|nr:AAA domain-containing protein [Candidatus Obscuribacterales bacterium]